MKSIDADIEPIIAQDVFEGEEILDEEDDTPDYNNYMRLDVDLWSGDPRVKAIVNTIGSEMDYTSDLAVSNLTVILLNLYKCYVLSPDKWIAYSKRPGHYKYIFQYNRHNVSYRPVIKITEYLRVNDYTSYKVGFRDATTRLSRMKATQKLVDLFKRYKFSRDVLGEPRVKDVIRLKDEFKKELKYDDNAYNQAGSKRKLVQKYNALLESTYIDLDVEGYVPEKCVYIDQSRKHVYRVFSNGSFTQGGRFYGAWWIGIPEDLRSRIIINNMEVMEYDFKGMHLKMLYSKEGIPYELGDPYRVPGYEQTKKIRNIFKTLTLILLNAKPGVDIEIAFEKDYNKKPYKYPPLNELPDINKASEDMKTYHHKIKKHFFSGIGIKLQYEDSQIAEAVISTLTDMKIPVLSVHDSFVFPRRHENIVSTIMREAFRAHGNLNINDMVVFKYSERNSYTEDQGNYEYNINAITDEELKQRMLYYKETKGIPDTFYQIGLHTTECKCYKKNPKQDLLE